LLVATTLSTVSATALAERKNPLEGQPAVRVRQLLRNNRFELAPTFQFSINPDFKYILAPGLKASYHINDYIAATLTFAYGLNVDTGLADKIIGSLPDGASEPLAPTKQQARDAMNYTTWMLGIRADASPLFGKLSLFGKGFMQYDFYVFAGVGIAGLAAGWESSNASLALGNTGVKAGPEFGAGVHFFVNRFFALNIEFKDMLFQDNPSGRDVNGDGSVNDGDLSWVGHYYFTFGLSFYLPPGIKSSR
jgi:outer membrane beta-barrel protein